MISGNNDEEVSKTYQLDILSPCKDNVKVDNQNNLEKFNDGTTKKRNSLNGILMNTINI